VSATDRVSPDVILLALAVRPGRTAHELATQLGLRITYGSRRLTRDYPVRSLLAQLEREGYVRHEDVPGGRGKLGFHRVWYPVIARLCQDADDASRERLEVIGRWMAARRMAA
jgi:hypothetical protein